MSKYNTGRGNSFDKSNKVFKNIQLGIVTTEGKVVENKDDKTQLAKDKRFNADPYIIRCRIIGDKYDNDHTDDKLPNCFPFTPKHTTVIPKKNEVVLVFMFGDDEKYTDRFYIGPIISDPTKLLKQTQSDGAEAAFSTSIVDPVEDISKLESAKGIYSQYDSDGNFSIDGRDNSDIVFKKSEILLRAGKFVDGKPLEFNQVNPAYIQIKHGFSVNKSETTSETISATNIVSNKINLLTYKDGSPEFNLTKRDLDGNLTPYITDDELEKILSEAHPLVFGDLLVNYLKLLRSAFINHVHNGSGNKPTDLTTGNILSVKDFTEAAASLEKDMLSRNVRIN
jgi:hypothetical protein